MICLPGGGARLDRAIGGNGLLQAARLKLGQLHQNAGLARGRRRPTHRQHSQRGKGKRPRQRTLHRFMHAIDGPGCRIGQPEAEARRSAGCDPRRGCVRARRLRVLAAMQSFHNRSSCADRDCLGHRRRVRFARATGPRRRPRVPEPGQRRAFAPARPDRECWQPCCRGGLDTAAAAKSGWRQVWAIWPWLRLKIGRSKVAFGPAETTPVVSEPHDPPSTNAGKLPQNRGAHIFLGGAITKLQRHQIGAALGQACDQWAEFGRQRPQFRGSDGKAHLRHQAEQAVKPLPRLQPVEAQCRPAPARPRPRPQAAATARRA